MGVPMLPSYPESAYKELQRLVAKGCFKQANLQIATAEPPSATRAGSRCSSCSTTPA